MVISELNYWKARSSQFKLPDDKKVVCTILGHSEMLMMSVSKSYEACLESKDTKVLNMYNIFNLQK